MHCMFGRSFRGPHESPAQRVSWGEAEHRSERAFGFAGSEGYGGGDTDAASQPEQEAEGFPELTENPYKKITDSKKESVIFLFISGIGHSFLTARSSM